MTLLTLTTFGLPGLMRDGAPVALTLRKGLALLVYLAEAGQPVARDILASLFWPEHDSAAARSMLRRSLYRIEQAVGATLFVADRQSVGLAPDLDLRLDSRQFEAACDAGDYAQAATHYTADYLDGFALPDCAAFEEWAFFRREALRGRLVQALERLVQQGLSAGDAAQAASYAYRLVALDPLSEVYARHLIVALLAAGDRTGAERHYTALRSRLVAELGVQPEEETAALLTAAPTAPTPVRYVASAGVHLAWQATGSGTRDILVMPGFVSHVERLWEHRPSRDFLDSLAPLGRVLLFDRRGVGLSDRVGSAPTVEVTADDMTAVLDAAGSRRVVLFGASESGPACIRFALDHPGRVAALVLFGALAKGSRAPDYPHALRAEQFALWEQSLVSAWGGPAGLEVFAPSLRDDPATRHWWASLLRSASSPGSLRAVLAALRDTDVRKLLPRLRVPVLVMHRRGDKAVRFAAGEDLAQRIPGAHFVPLAGDDHWFFAGDQPPLRAALAAFLASVK